MLTLSHISQPGIIPDARRRALSRLNPGPATVNAPTDFVNGPRYRHAELRMGVVSHIVAGNTVIIHQFNNNNGDLGINSDRQRR